jgi:hypothetical protein
MDWLYVYSPGGFCRGVDDPPLLCPLRGETIKKTPISNVAQTPAFARLPAPIFATALLA